MSEASIVHWRSVASEWRHFASPLRPCAEDTRYMSGVIAEHFGSRPNLKAMLCGVTPEIALMPWPAGTFLTAIEHSREMIEQVWPGDLPGTREALQGDWLGDAAAGRSFDVVIGDGCFISMPYPDGYRALAARIAAALESDGLLVMRFFVPPEEREYPDRVFADLLKGEIGSFHAFKWRLTMALQDDPRDGVRLHDIFTAWRDSGIDPRKLVDQTGWSREAVGTIDLYEGKHNRFAFVPLADAVALLLPFFSVRATYTPGYELGERCPILVASRRAVPAMDAR